MSSPFWALLLLLLMKEEKFFFGDSQIMGSIYTRLSMLPLQLQQTSPISLTSDFQMISSISASSCASETLAPS